MADYESTKRFVILFASDSHKFPLFLSSRCLFYPANLSPQIGLIVVLSFSSGFQLDDLLFPALSFGCRYFTGRRKR